VEERNNSVSAFDGPRQLDRSLRPVHHGRTSHHPTTIKSTMAERNLAPGAPSDLPPRPTRPIDVRASTPVDLAQSSSPQYASPGGSGGRRGRRAKVQTANHLLMFKRGDSPERGLPSTPSPARRSTGGGQSAQGKSGTLSHWARKERFVQANYSFALEKGAEAPAASDDVDKLVEWNAIALAIVPVAVSPTDASVRPGTTCPICLDTCRAPRLTRCGHIFCAACIAVHLSYSEKATGWHPCPLCNEPVYAKHLKMVAYRVLTAVQEDTTITMSVMVRHRSSSQPVSMDSGRVRPRFAQIEEHVFAAHVRDNLKELHEYACDNPNRVDAINDAIQQLGERLRSLGTDPSGSTECADPMMFSMDDDVNEEVEDWRQKISTPEGGSDFKFFAQACDGQQVFLDAFTARCLLREFGSFHDCPAKFEGRVLSLQKHVMTEDFRARLRYLSHLPLGCEFALCEVDICHLLSASTLSEVSGELLRRNQRRSSEQADRVRSTEEPVGVMSDFLEQRRSLGIVDHPEFTETMGLQESMQGEQRPAVLASFPELVSKNSPSPPAIVRGTTDESPSSYARVTEGMGHFPSLTEVGPRPAQNGHWTGSGSWGKKSDPLGVGPTAMEASVLPERWRSEEERESGRTPPKSSRAKKKSAKGRVVILSNARGAPKE